MPFNIYDFVDNNNKNVIKDWTSALQKQQRAKLNEKLDKLFLYGDDLFPHMLTNSNEPGILKLRCKGNVQLRPLLCRGPIDINTEYTLLIGAKEVGGKFQPKDAPLTAQDRKTSVKSDPNNRRAWHERVD